MKCFGVDRHGVIIPLVVFSKTNIGDGCFEYLFEIDSDNPTDYMKLHYRASFVSFIASSENSIFEESENIFETMSDALLSIKSTLETEKELILKSLDLINSKINKNQLRIDSLT